MLIIWYDLYNKWEKYNNNIVLLIITGKGWYLCRIKT